MVEENIIAPPSQVQYAGTSEKITQARNAIIGNLINWNGCKLVISAREYARVKKLCPTVPQIAKHHK